MLYQNYRPSNAIYTPLNPGDRVCVLADPVYERVVPQPAPAPSPCEVKTTTTTEWRVSTITSTSTEHTTSTTTTTEEIAIPTIVTEKSTAIETKTDYVPTIITEKTTITEAHLTVFPAKKQKQVTCAAKKGPVGSQSMAWKLYMTAQEWQNASRDFRSYHLLKSSHNQSRRE